MRTVLCILFSGYCCLLMFVLVSTISVLSTAFPFQVQSRTFSCGLRATCNCGIAAREGDDVVVVDFCSGGPMSARFASQREPAFGTTLHMGSNGRDFQV